ncbi:hypothetical protein CP8484711_0984B, partial [Chlamydia psittaci 84-8471/1]
EKVVFWSIGSN